MCDSTKSKGLCSRRQRTLNLWICVFHSCVFLLEKSISFSARGSWIQSERRGHRNTGAALMSLSLPVFPEPPHALGMLHKAHFTSTHMVPPCPVKRCQSSPALPAQPALFPAHCSAPSFTQDRGISITQLLLQLHKFDDAANPI